MTIPWIGVVRKTWLVYNRVKKGVCNKMAKIDVKCPYCGSINVIKHGVTPAGYQRFRCRNEQCTVKTFQLEYMYEACYPDVDGKIVAMAVNASGIRDTARVLHVSTDKVMNTLKKQNRKLNT